VAKLTTPISPSYVPIAIKSYIDDDGRLAMADESRRQKALERIKQNIVQYGHHVYIVDGGPSPRFSYTIGLSQRYGGELILAGAAFFSNEETVQIINHIAAKLGSGEPWNTSFKLALGAFSLRGSDLTWTSKLMLGALDFYDSSDVPAFQIVPDEDHWTVEIPDLSQPWSAVAEPAWRWLEEPWRHDVPSGSVAVTNLAALRGDRITEAARWEEDEWELFAGAAPDVPEEEIRTVPLGTLLAVDESLLPVVGLPVGRALWRDVDSDWRPWESTGSR
jgi:hypothetical protein